MEMNLEQIVDSFDHCSFGISRKKCSYGKDCDYTEVGCMIDLSTDVAKILHEVEKYQWHDLEPGQIPEGDFDDSTMFLCYDGLYDRYHLFRWWALKDRKTSKNITAYRLFKLYEPKENS